MSTIRLNENTFMKNGVAFEIPQEKVFINYVTKKSYTGDNVKLLKKSGFDGEFITFRQCVSIGGKVPKGTKSVASLLKYLPQNELDTKKPVVKRFAVFHVSQVELPELAVS